ncbi:TraK family protein [Legionella pneumophila serogroup 1]
MNSSLSERIAKSQSKKNGANNTKNKVAFLALKEDIIEALSDGWPMKAIWDTLTEEEKISFTYKTFRLYVAQFIRNESKNEPQEKTKEDKKKKSNATNEIKGFTYNPIPNLEELL